MRGLVLVAMAGCGFTGKSSEVMTPGDGAPDTPLIDGATLASDGHVTDAFVPEVIGRYNLGGGAFTGSDYPGTWAADPGNLCDGTVSNLNASAPISGTVDDALFQKQRYGIPTLTCQLALPNGDYSVTMLFGPIYYGTGATPGCPFTFDQIFDINIQGIKVVAAYNLTADSGGCVEDGSSAHPVPKTFAVQVTTGSLTISLVAPDHNSMQQAAELSALQILTAP